MKKYKLPDRDEWDKIVDEAFSSDDMHVFSENYRIKKQSMRKGITMKKNNLIMNLTVTAAALAVVAFPTGIYLTTRTAETTPATEVSSDENTEMSAEAMNNETFYALEMGWLPEGFEKLEENEEGICYGKSGGEAEITVLFLKNVSYTPIAFNPDNNIVNTVEAGISDGRSFVINYNDSYDEELADPNVIGRRAMVAFDGTNYLARLIVTDSISKDDLKKIINEMKLIPSDTETAKDYHPSNLTAVEVSNGIEDGEINEETHVFTEDNTDYNTIYDVEYGWLPEGIEYQGEDSPYGNKFHNWTTSDGMTLVFCKVPEGTEYYEDTGNPDIETTKTEFHIDGKNVSMYYRSTYNPDNPELNFGRIAFIYFDNTPYVLQLYVTDGISEEDFSRIIENLKLVPSDTETAQIYQQESGNENESNVSFDTGSYERLGTSVDEAEIVQVGDEIYEKYPDSWGNVTAKVTGVRFDNDFNGLTNDSIGLLADYNGYLDDDNRLIENVRTWYTNADKNEVFETQTVPVSVMTVVVTYTNNGDTPINDYCVCPDLQTICEGYFFKPSIYNKIEMQNKSQKNSVDYDDTFIHLESDNMCFSFSSPNQSSKNNIDLAPRETAEVTLAYIVEDKLRDNLYLSMNENGFVNLSGLE
ncbi:MAG: hypothetical protein NC177_06650 [Ruminococcus flavefaciens]|nr:hypothetical protein [Ruminococcus flavefaciens]